MAKRPTSTRHKRLRSAIISASFLGVLPLLSLMQAGSENGSEDVALAETEAQPASTAVPTATPATSTSAENAASSSKSPGIAAPVATATPTTTAPDQTTTAKAPSSYTRSKAS